MKTRTNFRKLLWGVLSVKSQLMLEPRCELGIDLNIAFNFDINSQCTVFNISNQTVVKAR